MKFSQHLKTMHGRTVHLQHGRVFTTERELWLHVRQLSMKEKKTDITLTTILMNFGINTQMKH